MENEAVGSGPASGSGSTNSRRKISLGKNNNGTDGLDISTSHTDPLRRPLQSQRRSSSASSGSIANQNTRSHNGSVEESGIGKNRRVSSANSGNGEENQLSINPTYKIPILGYEVMEERAKFTVFKLRVENEQLNEHWLVFRRYTDFERLYAKLKEEYPLLAISLPPKRWLRDNFETSFLEERLKGLQAFVDSILLRHKLTQSPTVREFFCFDDPPLQYSESNAEVHLSLEENKLAGTLQAKQNEIDVLKTELLLMKTQYDNLLRLTKNCGHCNNIQQRKSLTSPPTYKRSNNSSASSSVNASPKKHVEKNDGLIKIRRHSNASSSSSSTSTSYADIPNKLPQNTNTKPKRQSCAGRVESLQTASDGLSNHQPHAPPRKPRKSMPSCSNSTASGGKLESTNSNSTAQSNSAPKTSTPEVSPPLRDETTIDLTPDDQTSKAAGGMIL